MRASFFVLILLILLLASCLEKRPEGILKEDQVTKLLTDVHMLDGYLQTLPIDSSQKVIDTLYRQLLSHYGLDSVAFERNLDYYYADPVLTEKIYTNIQKQLSDAERDFNRADSLRYAVERDSLNRVAHFQRLVDIKLNLWTFHPDSNFRFDYEGYKESVYRPSGLGYLWRRTELIPLDAPKAIVADSVQVKNQPVETTEAR
ncbi:DUF4296 domain-containing protein [Sphingobacterium corticibacter]|uniref:DUF4296 domain-containing protein n=1 Tax=Sphingobacterium corticibacter TaxID=2171749 RepID=A0A2T8HNT7_9SPHI|nr:DUF4296 domain-containing protein [Sphingobacterium corticibacter]PVH27119.1 hypothetical protein DC487_05865 [Sphingobacterium corticibacter]